MSEPKCAMMCVSLAELESFMCGLMTGMMDSCMAVADCTACVGSSSPAGFSSKSSSMLQKCRVGPRAGSTSWEAGSARQFNWAEGWI